MHVTKMVRPKFTIFGERSSNEGADQAVAIGLSYLFRASGVVLGVSGSTNLLFNVLRWGLEKHLDVPDTVKVSQWF